MKSNIPSLTQNSINGKRPQLDPYWIYYVSPFKGYKLHNPDLGSILLDIYIPISGIYIILGDIYNIYPYVNWMKNQDFVNIFWDPKRENLDFFNIFWDPNRARYMEYILYIRCFFVVYPTIYPLNLGIFSSSACGLGQKMPRFRGFIVAQT